MTWSIVARDKASGCFGIAVASKFFAVGSRVPHIATGIGAVATQALINPFYGVEGIRLLGQGIDAPDVVRRVTASDAGRDHRQIHVMDAAGRISAHTGAQCIAWCGHHAGPDCSFAGNMLAGPQVLEETARAYAEYSALSFPRRLIAAMRAGEAAGGDKRGKQSAALMIVGAEQWPDLDLRVDDHADPLGEIERLERVSRERFIPFNHFLPSHRDPVGITDREVIERGIAKALAQADHR